MTEQETIFPLSLDAFLPLVDGFHPIDELDLNDKASALEQIQKALGIGISPAYSGTAIGPKGKNTDLRARLDTFLDDNGSLRDIAFITGATNVGWFDEDLQGFEVPFGKTFTSLNYTVLFSAIGGDSTDSWAWEVPTYYWVKQKSFSSCRVVGRGHLNQKLGFFIQKKVDFAALIIGDGSLI